MRPELLREEKSGLGRGATQPHRAGGVDEAAPSFSGLIELSWMDCSHPPLRKVDQSVGLPLFVTEFVGDNQSGEDPM